MGTSGIASDFLDKTVQQDENHVQEHKKCEKVTLGQHGTI